MNIRLLLVCWVVLSAPRAVADTAIPPDDDETRRFLDRVNRPVVLERGSPSRVTVQANLFYRRDVDASRADVYLPPKARRPAAIVVLVHGGVGSSFPVRPKDWGLYQSWGRLLASQGFVAVTFNHRLGHPEPMIEEAASDLDSLIGFARSSAREWNADPERIAIATYSAGGMLLASALREPRSWLRSVVAFYPIVDLTVSAHLKRQLTPEHLATHSLGTHLDAVATRMPPLMLVRAGRDQIPDLLAGLDRFVGQAMASNAPLVLVNHAEAEHGFDNQEPTERTVAVLKLALAFLAETTKLGERR